MPLEELMLNSEKGRLCQPNGLTQCEHTVLVICLMVGPYMEVVSLVYLICTPIPTCFISTLIAQSNSKRGSCQVQIMKSPSGADSVGAQCTSNSSRLAVCEFTF